MTMKSTCLRLLAIALLWAGCGRQRTLSSSDHPAAPVSAEEKAQAEQLRGQASKEVDRNMPENAFNLLTEALRHDPTNGRIYRDRGALFVQQEQTDDGLADLSKAISLDPTDAVAFLFTAIAYSDQRKFDRAITAFSETIRLEGGKNPLILGSRAEAYAKNGDFKNAIADLNRSIALAQESAPLLANLYYQLGVALLEEKRNADAVKAFQEALKQNPQLSIANAKLALAFARQGNAEDARICYVKALSAFEQAIASEPDQGEYYRFRGEIYHDLGNQAQAEADARKARELTVARQQAFGNLALSAHYHDRAIAAFSRAIAADPSNPQLFLLRAKAFRMKGNQARAEADEKSAARLSRN